MEHWRFFDRALLRTWVYPDSIHLSHQKATTTTGESIHQDFLGGGGMEAVVFPLTPKTRLKSPMAGGLFGKMAHGS